LERDTSLRLACRRDTLVGELTTSRYRTPIRELYLCGTAAHPGGGVMGTAWQP